MPIIENFQKWTEHHRNFPTQYHKFLFRDILNYTDEEIKNLSLLDYNLALNYALETYIRRDLVFVMSSIYGGKKKGKSGKGTTIIVPQPEIEEWVRKQYEDDEVDDLE